MNRYPRQIHQRIQAQRESHQKMEASTSEPNTACTASLKQDYWPTNSSKNTSTNTSTNTDTNKANWYLAFGSMTHNPYSSHWLLMTSASNKLVKNMHNISRMLLKEHYKLTCNWTGKRYIRISLDWDNNKRQVHLSMPNYVQKALKQFQHKEGKLQHVPYQNAPIQYGANKKYATQESKAPLLDNKAKQFIQQVCGKFLFLGRAVDSTILCPISAIALQSSKPTEDTM
jgi:hypothetical protein